VDDHISSDQHTRSMGMQGLSRHISGFQVKKMDNEGFIMCGLFPFFECFRWVFSSIRVVKTNRVVKSKKMREGDICKKICICKHANVGESEEILSGAQAAWEGV